ncbi:NAD-dependent deacetylase [Asticcacaulis biprosthecium C19]|uniref:NAD-dependent protein deacylase n=1 Tax=Asticcacaulis biprosthecium C19 TaxID=715226 RepID=F4QJ02_9CAUL|nr:NAD-dependent deacylase [Asticcacaulis biprosthecium]EGF93065.1 NAD-dependent deacetylase [Asticcacaulis biprosthecium C19]
MTVIQNIVILTGAGISAESGVPTFRASDGLWCGHRVDEVATPEGFEANPALVQDFYNQRRRQLAEVEPNAAHHALARLAAEWDRGEVLVVTQNVDDLHDRAHAVTRTADCVLHLHGELLKARHLETGHVSDWSGDMAADGDVRPHIVWFGEMPLDMDVIYRALRKSHLFLSIGTSGNVYPAAGFVQEASRAGAHTVELNLEPSLGHSLFDEKILGPATKVVPEYVERLLAVV